MKANKILVCLILAMCSTILPGQNRFMMLPPVVNLDALEPVMQGHVHFTTEPMAWTATVSDDWLMMEPMSGVGATNLFFTAELNDGPRRQATITFNSIDGTVAPLVVEVRQHQFLQPGMIEMDYNLLMFVKPVIQPQMPLTGIINTSYTPFEQDVYFSLLGRLDPGHAPVWLVRNAWMPSASYMPDRQSLSHLFSLGDMGLAFGDPVGDLQFAWTVSFDGDTLMPWVPEYAWTTHELVPDVFSAAGRPESSFFVMDTVPNFWPVIKLPWEITDVVYIGCAMPNGDLDGSSSSGYDVNGCGPAAASNSLNWLEGEHPEIEIPGGWREGFEQLGTLMDRDSGKPVGDSDFIRAKLDFIEMYDLPIKVKYQANTVEGDVDSSSGNTSADDQDGDAANLPAKDWMVGELEDGEDVEVGVGYPGGGGHWVAATGTYTVNGQTYLFFKHDIDQTKPDSTKQQGSPVTETDGVMSLPGLGNARVEIVVSESYDPDHVPVPDTETFDKYCQSFKRTIPPDADITITYPENPDRCFNTTVRVLNRAESDSYVNEATWNFNSGQSRTYHNDTGQPVTVEFHNDDHYDGGPPIKTYRWYEVIVAKSLNNPTGITDPSNEDVYAGFSIGTGDESSEEFGPITDSEVLYVHYKGSRLKDFPNGMSSSGVKKLTVRYVIPMWNRYWMNMGMELGIAAVQQQANLIIDCPSTGFSDTLLIDKKGSKYVTLGGAGVVSFFDISFTLDGPGSFEFDNVGIPSLVQIEPTIEVEPDWLLVDADHSGDTLFSMRNLGGSDMNWLLSKTADWFDLSPVSGINEGDVMVQYQANNGAARQDTITIQATGARNTPVYLVVKQDSSASFVEVIRKGLVRLDIYPNPNQGEFTLSLTGLDPGMVTCKILDITGRSLFSQQEMVTGAIWQAQISAPELSAGTYFLFVETQKQTFKEKLVVKKGPKD